MLKESNGHIAEVCERAQKITEALYRVTDLFRDQEPLKWVLRKEGVGILEAILNLKAHLPHEGFRELNLIGERIERTIQILELASSSSFISETNFQVLKREYGFLVDVIENRRSEFLLEPLIIKEEIKPLSIKGSKNESRKPSNSIGQSFGHLYNGHSRDNNGQKSRTTSNERKQKILSYIKEKDWVSVGELARFFQGKISEKTVQRDLIGLAAEGLLLKEGDKRWRKYKMGGV